ncbi:MAG TPA: ATP-binding cassette domain-containing protein, partial [Anaerolineae bacterium]|nr:ATP-binding cassette domain-containing protein [Anaerolineae bacterium]
AAHLANADQFIERLPQGYQTPLSERASNLSEGQRQLLSIARAALADPAILILDEATSSVDTRTEVGIHQALLKLMEGRTTLVIAHRLSTIRNADVVLVIDQGRIIERGTHDELLAQRGFYHDLYMSQFRRAEVLGQG